MTSVRSYFLSEAANPDHYQPSPTQMRNVTTVVYVQADGKCSKASVRIILGQPCTAEAVPWYDPIKDPKLDGKPVCS